MVPIVTKTHFHRVSQLSARSYARSFLAGAVVLLALSLLAALITVVALSFMPALAQLQLPLVLDDAGVGVSPFGFSVLLTEVAIPGGILILLVMGVSYVALTRIINSALLGATLHVGAALVHALRYCLPAAAAFVSVAVSAALLVILTPVLVLLGVLGLVASLIFRIAGKPFPIPARWLLVAIIPAAPSVVLAWRSCLALPLVALEGHGPFAAIKRSVKISRGAPVWMPVSLALVFAAYFAVQFAVGALGALGVAPGVVTVIALITQALTFPFPVAVLVVITRELRTADYPILALPKLRRPLSVSATASVATLALLIGVLMPVVPTQGAYADEPGGTGVSQTDGENAPGLTGEPGPGAGSDVGEGGGENPPGEGGGETPPGEPGDADPNFVFAPVLSAQEGELTAPLSPITLWVEAGTVDGGQVPYTFFFDVFLLGPNNERTQLNLNYPIQAHGGGRTGAYELNQDQVYDLGVGAHRFVIDTWYMATRNSPRLAGPSVEYTHLIGEIDATTQVALATTTPTLLADESLQLSAAVAGDSGPVIAGAVTFEQLDGWPVQSVTVPVDASGNAVASFSGLSIGQHSFQATYRYAAAGVIAASNTVLVTVVPFPVQLSLTPPTDSTYSSTAVFPFTLLAMRGGVAPTGMVEMLDGGVVVAQATLAPENYAGGQYQGTISTDALSVGAHTLTARFASSNGQHGSVTSAAVTHQVVPVPVTLDITSSAGWELPRGSSTLLTVELVVPDGLAALPAGGQLTVAVGADSRIVNLAAGQTRVEIPLSDLDANQAITATLSGYPTHMATPATAQLAMRAVHTRAFVVLNSPGLPGHPQGFTAWVEGETDLRPVDGAVQVRLAGEQTWLSLPLDGTSSVPFEYVLGIGEHTVQARFVTGRPGEFESSDISDASFYITSATTVLTASGPIVPPRVGQGYQITVAANNQYSYPALDGPEGQVSVVRGGQAVATAEISAGIATLVIPASVVGSDELQISYAGSSTHSAAVTVLSVPIELWPATTSVQQNPATPIVGEAVELTATVASGVPAETAVVAGGTVEFRRGNQLLGTATIAADGTARLQTTAAPNPGADNLSANFLGLPGVVAPHIETITPMVTAATTQLEFLEVPASVHGQDRVSVKMAVIVDSRTTLQPAGGTVSISGSFTGSPQVQALESDGTATFSLIAPIAEGQTFDLTAQYSGTAQLEPSGARTWIRVDATPVTLSLTSPDSLVAGESATVSVAMSVAGAAPIPATGVIDLYTGTTLIGSRALTMGMGSQIDFSVATPAQLAIGRHQLTARFRSAFGYQPATSTARSITVLGRETEVLLAVSPASGVPSGTPVKVTATVNVVWSDNPAYGEVWLRSAATDEVLGIGNLIWSHTDRTIATFTLNSLAIGGHDLYAQYVPIGNLNAGSRSQTANLEVTGRQVSLLPYYGEIRVGQNKTVQVDVRDASSVNGSLPGGEVDILLGGQVVGTAVTAAVVDLLTTRAEVVIPLRYLTGGEQEFTVRFRSTNNVHSYAQRSDVMPVGKLTPQISIVPVGDLSRLQWGHDFYVSVNVNRSAEAGAEALPAPTGAVDVQLASGGTCEPSGVQYRCTPSQPGAVAVSVSAADDTNYVSAQLRQNVATAAKRTPVLTADLTPYAYPVETGAEQNLSWQLDGPAATPVVSGVPAGANCLVGASGSCQFRFAADQAGAQQHLRVEFAGDSFWEPVVWQRTVTPVGCYPLTLRPQPLGWGSAAVAVVDGAECANADGYRAGTRVGVRVTPADSGSVSWQYQLHQIGNQQPSDAVSGLHWFRVGSGSNEVTDITVQFTSQTVCYPVTLQNIGYSNQSWGSVLLGQQPNCPGRTGWEQGSSPQQSGLRNVTSVGWYLAGTTLNPAVDGNGSGELYSARLVEDDPYRFEAVPWSRQLPQGFTVTEAVRVQARFGAACVPVTFQSTGPGRVDRLTAPNCQDQFRPDQYQRDTEVRWEATPEAGQLAYVNSFSGAQSAPVSQAVTDARTGIARYTTWASAGLNAGQLTFAQCRTLNMVNMSPQWWELSASESDCPVSQNPAAESGSWRYRDGSTVQLIAYVKGMHYSQPVFSSWHFPQALTDSAQAALNYDPRASFAITQDINLQPAFVTPGECAPLSVTTASAQVEVMVLPGGEGLARCREGQLLSGWTGGVLTGEVSAGALSVKARATSGNPKLGWVVSGAGADPNSPSPGVGTPGGELSLGSSGGRTLTAFACQEIGSYLGLTDISGEVGIAKQRDGTFIEITPAANCPFSSSAWLIGTELTLTAAADERGYEFHGWGGVAVPSADDARSATYTVRDDAPTVAVTALYQVICYTLTVAGKAHRVTTMPAPNCPGAQPGAEYTGQYIGGTPVALVGEIPGGNVWQGWRGDLVETGKVRVAVAIMDADKTAEHRYRSKSWDEKAVDFFEDAGDILAVAAKKGLGAVAYVAGKAIQEVPPFNMLGEAFEVISLVGEVLNFVGVPKSITKYFDYPAQSLDWVLSGFTCLASASLSSQNGGHSANLSGVAESNQRAIDNAGGSVFRAIGIDPGDDNELVGETLEKLYVTGKALGYAQKYTGTGGGISKAMDTIDMGLEIYDMVTGPQGVGWDNSASDAWDSDMGNHLTGCMAAATPDFIRGALPISKKDFDRYEEDYGL